MAKHTRRERQAPLIVTGTARLLFLFALLGLTCLIARCDYFRALWGGTNKYTLIEVGSCDTPGCAYDVVVADTLTFVADGDGLRVLNVADPATPTEVGSVSLGGVIWDVQVVGDFAYLTEYEGYLLVVDISDPTSPRQVGRLGPNPTYFAVCCVLVAGDYAYCSTPKGLIVVDVSQPESLAVMGECRTNTETWQIAKSGGYVYAVSKAGLAVFDISNPSEPQKVNGIGLSGMVPGEERFLGIEADGNVLHVCRPSKDYATYDISSPEHPIEIGNFKTEAYRYPYALAVQETTTFLLVSPSGQPHSLCAVVTDNPRSPRQIASVEVLSCSYGLAVSNGCVFVAAGLEGLKIYDLEQQ